MSGVNDDFESEVRDAVKYYWSKLSGQAEEQRESENTTRGRRAEVLGGKQMSGFAGLIEDILVNAGVPRDSIHHDYQATLPGWFRHEKEWDTAVVHDDELLAALEYKSQASSFGNNLNNRTEEVLGSSTDLIHAYEEGLFEPSPQPWIGYLFLMADTEESRAPKTLREPNFPADEAFQDACYIDRMEMLILRMQRQRIITQGAFLLSDEERGLEGDYWEPNEEITFRRFARSLVAHVEGAIDIQQDTFDV